ncbi:hypothetical protein EWI61_13350 [Methylolobus aquaticus]|nr:hypothetical protein EWI61_13350 [Methylolobus aquaticus]
MSTVALAGALRSRALWLGLLTAMLWFFPDATLSAMGSVLHVIVGWIEIALKSLLEGAFGLSHRTAQVIVAWGGMGALLVGLGIAARRLWCCATKGVALLRSVAPLTMAVLRFAHFGTSVRRAMLAATGVALALYGFA